MSKEYAIKSIGVQIVRNFNGTTLTLTQEEWDQFVAFARVVQSSLPSEFIAGRKFIEQYAKFQLTPANTATAYYAALEFIRDDK